MSIDTLSDARKAIIREYTANSSTAVNNYLRNQIMVIPEFSCDKAFKTMIINSIIYHLGQIRPECYSAFDKDTYLVSTENNPTERASVPTGSKVLESAFLSTVPTREDLITVSNFFNREDSCCLKSIRNTTRMPFLDISSVSHYPDQRELLLPYGIVMKYNERSYTNVTYYYGVPQGHLFERQGEQYRLRNTVIVNGIVQTPVERPVLTYEYNILSTMVRRPLMNYINMILKTYYFTPEPCQDNTSHEWSHICSVILLATIIYSSLIEAEGRRINIHNLNILILSCLFHDIGRECKDGVDDETISANRAYSLLSGHPQWGRYAESVKAVINSKMPFDMLDFTLQNIRLACKGADSIDIGRVNTYNPRLNPLNKAKQQQQQQQQQEDDSATFAYIKSATGPMGRIDPKLYDACNVRTYTHIRNILLDATPTVPTQQRIDANPRRTYNFSVNRPKTVLIEKDAQNNHYIQSKHAIWSGPYVIPPHQYIFDYLGFALPGAVAVDDDIGDREEDFKVYIEPTINRDGVITMDTIVDVRSNHIAKVQANPRAADSKDVFKNIDYCQDEGTRAPEACVLGIGTTNKVLKILDLNHAELKELIVKINKMFYVTSNHDYLFDMFLYGMLPLLPSIPTFHKYSSYVHFSYYTPESVESDVITPP